MFKYTTSFPFNENLKLEVTETEVYNKIEFRFKGFESFEQAKEFATWWEDYIGFGYSPYSQAIVDTAGNFVVLGSRYNSCD